MTARQLTVESNLYVQRLTWYPLQSYAHGCPRWRYVVLSTCRFINRPKDKILLNMSRLGRSRLSWVKLKGTSGLYYKRVMVLIYV